MKCNRIVLAAAVGLLLPVAMAGVTPIGPFTGDLTETWESFDNYLVDPDFYRDDPTTIMGGGASISNPVMAIYEPGVAVFGLGSSGLADVSDGKKGMGLDEFASTATITFTTPMSAFGAYWGAATFDDDDEAIVSVDFYDEFGGLIDSVTFAYAHQDSGDGALDWHGWLSDTPIASIVYSGDFVVNDGLQANFGGGAVPAPGAALLGLIGLALAKRRA
jgi:hypothetical protein